MTGMGYGRQWVLVLPGAHAQVALLSSVGTIDRGVTFRSCHGWIFINDGARPSLFSRGRSAAHCLHI